MRDILNIFATLGEAKLLVPACLLAVFCMRRGARTSAWLWLLALGAAGAAVLASKLAFMGWGVGSAFWDFTGASGHAMVAIAIYPVLGFAVGNARSPRAARWLAAAGLLLAIAICASRIAIGAHSLSEVVVGLMLGALVAVPVLRRWPGSPSGVHVAAALLGFALSWWAGDHMAPQVRTHDVVTRLALALSGRDQPYTREALHQSRRASAALSPAR